MIKQFQNSSDPIRQQIGEALDRIRYNRNLADYDDTVVNLPTITRRSLKLAAQVISTLQSL